MGSDATEWQVAGPGQQVAVVLPVPSVGIPASRPARLAGEHFQHLQRAHSFVAVARILLVRRKLAVGTVLELERLGHHTLAARRTLAVVVVLGIRIQRRLAAAPDRDIVLRSQLLAQRHFLQHRIHRLGQHTGRASSFLLVPEQAAAVAQHPAGHTADRLRGPDLRRRKIAVVLPY